MGNKVIIAGAVILLGIVAGWYAFGGKFNIPTISQSGKQVAVPTIEPTSESSGLNRFREENISTTPSATGTGQTKGGIVATPPSTAAKVVTYTDSGFIPNVLTVKVGTAVTFTNNSSGGMWVASAVHPTHQLLPGFDQLKSVNRGGTYVYTFVKVGTWKYHNHVKPDITGTVIVTQ